MPSKPKEGKKRLPPVPVPKRRAPAAGPPGAVAAGGPVALDLGHIAEGLRPLAVPVGGLQFDPANARTHPEENLEGIRGSLAVYGQRKPLVVNRRTGAVEAGNGALRAALSLGWTHLAAVFVDDDPATAAGFAIADNRSAELAGWDKDALDKLLREVNTANDERLDKMLADLAAAEKVVPPEEGGGRAVPAAADETQPGERFAVLVECATEQEQAALLERLAGEGLTCKSLIV